MHPLMTIGDLDKLTDAELIRLEALLRDLAFAPSLADADLERVLASLSNAVFVRASRWAALRP